MQMNDFINGIMIILFIGIFVSGFINKAWPAKCLAAFFGVAFLGMISSVFAKIPGLALIIVAAIGCTIYERTKK